MLDSLRYRNVRDHGWRRTRYLADRHVRSILWEFTIADNARISALLANPEPSGIVHAIPVRGQEHPEAFLLLEGNDGFHAAGVADVGAHAGERVPEGGGEEKPDVRLNVGHGLAFNPWADGNLVVDGCWSGCITLGDIVCTDAKGRIVSQARATVDSRGCVHVEEG